MPKFNDTDYTAESLAKMNGMAIVALYNAAVGELARNPGDTNAGFLRPVNKFSDKATALKRTMAVLELAEQARGPKAIGGDGRELTQDEIGTEARVVEAPKLAEPLVGPDTDPNLALALERHNERVAKRREQIEAPKGKKERTPRVPRFVFPVNTIKPHREGTARDKAVKLLLRPEGATFEEVAEATGWDTFKKCYEGIRLLHFYLGYGMRQDADGRIHLRTK